MKVIGARGYIHRSGQNLAQCSSLRRCAKVQAEVVVFSTVHYLSLNSLSYFLDSASAENVAFAVGGSEGSKKNINTNLREVKKDPAKDLPRQLWRLLRPCFQLRISEEATT